VWPAIARNWNTFIFQTHFIHIHFTVIGVLWPCRKLLIIKPEIHFIANWTSNTVKFCISSDLIRKSSAVLQCVTVCYCVKMTSHAIKTNQNWKKIALFAHLHINLNKTIKLGSTFALVSDKNNTYVNLFSTHFTRTFGSLEILKKIDVSIVILCCCENQFKEYLLVHRPCQFVLIIYLYFTRLDLL